MTHFFERRDPWGNGLALWVILAMVFATPLGWHALKQIRLENDVEKWLPENDPELKVLHWVHQQFPADERIFVTWDGSSLNDPRIDKFVDKLIGGFDIDGIRRGGLPHVADVVEPRQLLNTMQNREVEPQEAMRRLEGLMIGAGTLKLRLTEFGKARLRRTQQELTTAAKSQFGIDLVFSSPVPDFSTLVAIPVPSGEEGKPSTETSAPSIIGLDGTLLSDETPDHDLQVVWKGIRPGSQQTKEIAEWLRAFIPPKGEGQKLVDRSFFVLGAPVVLAVSISDAGVADKVETVEVIRKAAASVGIPPETVRLGGSIVVAKELNQEVLKAAWDKSQPIIQLHRRSVILTSAIVGALLAYVLVRSIRLATIVLAISIFTTFMSTALVPITGGSMNMVIVVMPTLLMVLTLSAAIHVANYWKHAACQNEVTAIVETVRMSWMPCALASLTTSIGLVSLCTSSLIPVRDFGIYAAIGTMFSLVMVMYGLPAMLQIWPGKPPEEHELDHPGWRLLGKGLTTWPTSQALVVLGLCVLASYGLVRFRTETKAIRHFPDDSRIAQDYWFIETHLSGIMPIETIIRFDTKSQEETSFLERMEIVREISERMRQHSEITGAVSLADFQPVTEPLTDDSSSIVRIKHNKRARTIQQRIREGEISSAKAFYTVTKDAQGKESGMTQPRQASDDEETTPTSDELWRINAQVAVMTDNDFGAILKDINQDCQNVLKLQPGATHTITGTVPLFLRTQKAVLDSLISSFGLAFVLILGIFVAMLRNFWAGLVAMIPNIIPVTVVFGAISWLGHRVDIGTMITASIAMGIAVDGTLHYLTWVQLGMKKGRSRRDAIIDALVHSGPAMTHTSLAVAIGLMVLIPADLLLISRFGWLMASMIAVALFADVILMPQILAGPLGYLFEPVQTGSQSNSVTDSESSIESNATDNLRLRASISPLESSERESIEETSPATLPAPHLWSIDQPTQNSNREPKS